MSLHAKGRWHPGLAGRTLSLRGASEWATLDDWTRSAWSAGLEEHAVAYMNLERLSARYTEFLTLAGGNAGIEGGIDFDFAFGVWPRFDAGHGPVARVGAGARWMHGARYYNSLLELPHVELGYALLRPHAYAELAARAGPVLVGRYAIDDATSRRLGGSFEAGGHAALNLSPMRLEANFSRIFPRSDEIVGALDRLDGLLCVEREVVSLCARTMLERGDLPAKGDTLDARVTFVGFTMGLGRLEWRN